MPFKEVRNLVDGDRVRVASTRIVRTVREVVNSGFVNARNVPLVNVMYREGSTAEWSGGNSARPTDLWEVLDSE